ncbi:hypothetical protein N7G274_005874 [Stereocaulon virgatum]|uniref:Uncharacterized protein n=1 Tax=Stereocaulon virgatum TaxID=373712 RepID=A0ABR4AAJ4_9LECA
MLQIPTVTQDDLDAFHVRVFGYTTAPPRLIPLGETTYNDQHLDHNGDQNGSDLGYYSDGAKRTLTDDQVAMFRHSEIYAILRARQVHKENREADGDEHSDGQVDCIRGMLQAPTSSDEDSEMSSSKYVEETATIYESVPQNDASALQAKRSSSNKRKRDDANGVDVHDRARSSRSTRRVVRELDGAMPEDQVLDYGDGPSISAEDRALQSKHSPKVASSGNVKAAPEAQNTSQSPSAGGKTIWWPTLKYDH